MANPLIQTIRENLVTLLTDTITGSGSYWYNPTIYEGAPNADDLQTLSTPKLFVRRVSMARGDEQALNMTRRRMIATFEIHGYIESEDREAIERLEHDVAKAISTDPGLSCAATYTDILSVEFAEDELLAGSDTQKRRHHFLMTIESNLTEDL